MATRDPRPPIIGITTAPTTHVPAILGIPRPLQALDTSYLDAVARAGGVPVMLPPSPAAAVPALLDRLDGVLLPGGGDVDPARYGEERHPETYGVDPARDDLEVAVVEGALARRLPLLAICRGLQVLNVTLGGSLLQHIDGEQGDVHRDVERWDAPGHAITFAAGSCVAEVLGTTELHVNSLHHQAVARPGTGVEVVGRDEHGVVESIAVDGHPEVLAVQWHPELLAGHEPHSRLFDWLVEAAAGDQS
ncbi:gamma-glutamyl-gamma-aminobutyrate hydrolase family protein [Actinomarinicola tropica]|nr:gamma-glutamyl-gamma-aminobutyrate hydrolase family protein [Actinomarinicola tropica]